MHTIEIDFEVFKELTARRTTEDVTYNDVVRAALGMSPATAKTAGKPDMAALKKTLPWLSKGAKFPPGTEFLANYKGKQYRGKVEDGQFFVDDKPYLSLSAAAGDITGGPVNGWRFWFCKLPGEAGYKMAQRMRPGH